MDGWNSRFFLGRCIFRGYVCFRVVQLPKKKRPSIFFSTNFFFKERGAKLFVFGLENNAKNDWHSNEVCETFADANKALLLIHDYSAVGGNQSLSIKNQPHEFREKFSRIL